MCETDDLDVAQRRARRGTTPRILAMGLAAAALVLAGCSSDKPVKSVPPDILRPTTTTENPAVQFFNTTTTVPGP